MGSRHATSHRLARPSKTSPVTPLFSALVLGGTLIAGCTMDPPGPSPIYSRLPASQSGVPTGAQPLTPDQRKQYDAIDRQVIAEQNQAIAADAAAQAARYYTPYYAPYYGPYYASPVVVSGGYYGGGWGHGWGVGVGYGTGWGW